MAARKPKSPLNVRPLVHSGPEEVGSLTLTLQRNNQIVLTDEGSRRRIAVITLPPAESRTQVTVIAPAWVRVSRETKPSAHKGDEE